MTSVTKKTTITEGNITRVQNDIYCPEYGDNYKVEGQEITGGVGGTTLVAWALLGRIAVTNQLVEYNKAGDNGSEEVAGLLYLGLDEDITIAEAVKNENICITVGGKFDFSAIALPAGTALTDPVGTKTIYDRLIDRGFIPVPVTENTQI